MPKQCVVLILVGTFISTALTCASADPLKQAIKEKNNGDFAAALNVLRGLATRGNPDAEFELGEMYEYGEGVPRNATIALSWYRRSAESGVDSYQYIAGLMYERGWGTPPDGSRAVYWLRKAAIQGYAPAEGDLAEIYSEGKLVPSDAKQAAYWKSKEESNPHFRHLVLTPK
jgi:hypothetical protein